MRLKKIKTRERDSNNMLVDRESIINLDMVVAINRHVVDGPFILSLSGSDDIMIPAETVRDLLATDAVI